MARAQRQQDEDALADQYLDTATLGREVAAHALQQALKEAKAGTLKDPARTATNAITASAIALDKRLLLQERPTQITASADPSDSINALARRLGLTIDSTASEIPDAEIIAPNALSLPIEGDGAKRAGASN